METRMLWLALSGLAMVSCAKGDDSAGTGDDGGGDESDADTDADSDTDTDADTDADTDTDTDADTDVQGWDADAIQVDASFGFDAAAGTIQTMTYNGAALPNSVSATVYNQADLGTTNPSQFCFVTWTLPEGAIAANGDFPAEFWMSFDLSDAAISYSGVTTATGPKGNCEGMQSFLGVARGSADLASFAATFGIGFGVQSLQDVPTATVNDWRSNTWPANYAATYGAWNALSAAFAAGSFTLQGSAPNDADVMYAYEVDSKSWDVPFDPKTGVSNLVSMTGLTAPPTGYYQSLAMYSLGGVD
jgi:hypothetical protein